MKLNDADSSIVGIDTAMALCSALKTCPRMWPLEEWNRIARLTVAALQRTGTEIPAWLAAGGQAMEKASSLPRKVHFRHPATGEKRIGTVTAQGQQGAAIRDSQDGTLHRIDHGHYGAHNGAEDPPNQPRMKPRKESVETSSRLRETGEKLPRLREAVQGHLRLDPTSEPAVLAVAAALVDQAHLSPRVVVGLRGEDIQIDEGAALVRGRSHIHPVQDPRVVATLKWLKQHVDGPLLSFIDHAGKRQPLNPEALHRYLVDQGDTSAEDLHQFHASRHMAEAQEDPRSPPSQALAHVSRVMGHDNEQQTVGLVSKDIPLFRPGPPRDDSARPVVESHHYLHADERRFIHHAKPSANNKGAS